MPGSLTSGFLWSQWRGKRSRHSRRMGNPQFCLSGKKPMPWCIWLGFWVSPRHQQSYVTLHCVLQWITDKRTPHNCHLTFFFSSVISYVHACQRHKNKSETHIIYVGRIRPQPIAANIMIVMGLYCVLCITFCKFIFFFLTWLPIKPMGQIKSPSPPHSTAKLTVSDY